MALELSVEQGNGHRVIRATGEVDLGTSPKLREAILKNIASKEAVGIDLSGVGYMDSSGVATLVEGLKSCSPKKQTFAIVNPSESVMKVLQLARLDSLFDIRPSMDG